LQCIHVVHEGEQAETAGEGGMPAETVGYAQPAAGKNVAGNAEGGPTGILRHGGSGARGASTTVPELDGSRELCNSQEEEKETREVAREQRSEEVPGQIRSGQSGAVVQALSSQEALLECARLGQPDGRHSDLYHIRHTLQLPFTTEQLPIRFHVSIRTALCVQAVS